MPINLAQIKDVTHYQVLEGNNIRLLRILIGA